MLDRTMVMVEQTKSDGSRELGMLRNDLRGLVQESGDKADQLLGRVDSLASHSVQLAGDEMRCSMSQVNQHVRDGLDDLRAWWNDKPARARPPTICHIEPRYVAPSKVQEGGTAALAVRGFGFTPQNQVFVITDENGNSTKVDSSSIYVGLNGSQGVTLNLLRLRADGKLSCRTTKISYLAQDGTSAQEYSALVGCDQLPRLCPGGTKMVEGKCEECTFKLTDSPGSRVTKMVQDPHPGKNLVFLTQHCSDMEPGAEVEVAIGGDVTVSTNNIGTYGSWSKWLELEIRAPSLTARECSPKSTRYYAEHIASHSVKLCMLVTVPPHGKVPLELVLQRCKQGDAQTSCTLESNFEIRFRRIASPRTTATNATSP